MYLNENFKYVLDFYFKTPKVSKRNYQQLKTTI